MRTREILILLLACCIRSFASAVPVDTVGYRQESGVQLRHTDSRLFLNWQSETNQKASLALRLDRPDALIESLGAPGVVIRDSTPVFLLTVGSRTLEPPRGWIRFFDKVHKRPHSRHRAKLDIRSALVTSEGRSTSVTIDRLTAGQFEGSLRITVFTGTRLVRIEALLSTEADARAVVFDAGLVSSDKDWSRTAHLDPHDQLQHLSPQARATAVAVRQRMILGQTGRGAFAVFPEPHRYFYPLDFADNFKFTWQGKGYRDLVPESGLGIRLPPEGDNRFVPWFNAPPGTVQRMGFFVLAERSVEKAMAEVKRFTRDDRFKPLPGYKTFTSHYHVEHSLDVIQSKVADPAEDPRLKDPGFKQVFRRMGVDIVHLAEFHRGNTPRLVTDERLSQLKVMHDECRRLSEDDFLLLPGEEPNVHLGGHWISFFPKPVWWVLNRKPGEPFAEDRPGFGKVYHVGNSRDVLKLFELEGGLNWTAHARVKGSTGYPDLYRQEDFFQSNRFLGAAWKAMPADLSRPRLGERVLDLLDDMANWGMRKQVLGEVDVFKIQPGHELWGHMNINYLKLDHVPKYHDGWQSVLDALRLGDFFVTTGEILLSDFRQDGSSNPQTSITLRAKAEWTFPPAFARLVSGDGKRTYTETIPLRDREAFGREELPVTLPIHGRKWARLEVWDIAGNGAFTQPLWLEE